MDTQTFVARQPVFNQQERVFGYELLFRSGPENVFRSDSPDKASVSVLDKLLTFGSGSLTEGRWAFINCTRQFLLNEYATLLPRKETILEILENIEPDPEVIAACRKLKQAGYMIALDDFCYAEKFRPFIEITDFIKVDFLSTPLALRQLLVKKFVPMGIRMLAEKVETREDFHQARKMGYELFQGYFFCKPEILTSRQLPAYKLHYLHVLQAVSQPDLNVGELESVIQRDATLCYKLLRYVNSAIFGFRREISSLRHALTLIGDREVKKWASVVAMVEIAQDRPPELLVTSLTRARCCEQLASKIGMRGHASEFFLAGIFSLMDAIVGQSMPAILSGVSLPDAVKAALLGTRNRLRITLDLVVAYAEGRWAEVSRCAAALRLDESLIPDTYVDALEWATSVFES